MTTLHITNSINRSPLRRGFPGVLLVLALAWFSLSPAAQAVDPPPDGGYPNGNTAEGEDALFSLNIEYVGNTAIGYRALYSATTAAHNTATGHLALYFNTEGDFNTATGLAALYNNTTGNSNTATGWQALVGNTTGYYNTAVGYSALASNTTGIFNTAIGAHALVANTADENTATGFAALASNTTGNDNTATGAEALKSNTTGAQNTADGGAALQANTIGNFNTATGFNALFSNRTGIQNTGNGVNALFANRGGSNNTAIGTRALSSATTANGNTATGAGALFNDNTGANNTANGQNALFNNTTGARNIALGINAGVALTTGSDNIDIGAPGVAGESNTMRIGTVRQTSTFIAGIRGVTTRNANAIPVLIDSAGQLGTISSSKRFKKEIKPMDSASQAILGLKPVTFHYKSDKTATPQFGLIAEEVAEVNPDLVVRDENGEIYTVRYDAVNAMLLNEFLKEHRKVEEQEASIAALKSTVAQQQKGMEVLTAQLKEQASQIQKVAAQFEASKPAPQVVNNP